MKELAYNVEEFENGLLLREFLTSKKLSRALIKKAKYGGISVNGEAVTVRRVLKTGDKILIKMPIACSESIKPIDIPVNIVYEDEFLIVADKPTEMPTHPSKGNSLPTLANAIMAYMGHDFVFRAINRLDRDTSGLVLIAKDAHSAAKLSVSMKNHKIVKKYLAIVSGIPKESEGMIEAPIKRESENSVKRIVSPLGKYALTEYKILKSKDNSSLLEVTLHTGRTHQIRVHLSHIGHPLIGDFLYGERSKEGYFLKCFELSFPHPMTDEIVKIKI